ncbi:MAG: MinD/ParA family protein [Candidatus Hydrogenedentota bacterium]|nr:MAG: MinD/ParA family protein [Candidatus Hydrogenedentota bacterium]
MSRILHRLREVARARWTHLQKELEEYEKTHGPPHASASSPEEESLRLIPIASGKGGVGKTNIAVGLAIAAGLILHRNNKRVLLIDGDVGLPNTDLVLGVRPDRSLSDLIENGTFERIEDLIVPTRYPGLDFIAGSEEASLVLGNLYYQQRRKLMGQVARLTSSVVFFDLGAGGSKEVLDFFALSDSGILVVNPEPASIRDAYVFLKNAFLRRIRHTLETRRIARTFFDDILKDNSRDWKRLLDHLREAAEGGREDAKATLETWYDTRSSFRPLLIVNKAESFREARNTARSFEETARKHLDLHCRFLGPVLKDAAVERAVKRSRPFRIVEPQSPASKCVDEISRKLLGKETRPLESNIFRFGRFITDRILAEHP